MRQGGVVDRYRGGLRPGTVDEFLDAAGAPRAGWAALADAVDRLGEGGLRARREDAVRLLEADRVTRGAPADADRPAHLWQLDPLPLVLPGTEWSPLDRGLRQRALLLDHLYRDLYGARPLQFVALLRHAVAQPLPPSGEDVIFRSVLTATESVITYRRRSPGRPRLADLLRLLVLDPANPRAVRHQLDRLAADLADVATGYRWLDPAGPLPWPAER